MKAVSIIRENELSKKKIHFVGYLLFIMNEKNETNLFWK